MDPITYIVTYVESPLVTSKKFGVLGSEQEWGSRAPGFNPSHTCPPQVHTQTHTPLCVRHCIRCFRLDVLKLEGFGMREAEIAGEEVKAKRKLNQRTVRMESRSLQL